MKKRIELGIVATIPSTRHDEEVYIRLIDIVDKGKTIDTVIDFRSHWKSDTDEGYTQRGFAVPLDQIDKVISAMSNIQVAVKTLKEKK
jgi:hypothetical protein